MGLVPAVVRRESLMGIWTSTKSAKGRPGVFTRWLRARDVIGPGYFAARPFSTLKAYLLVVGLYIGSGYATGTVAAVMYLATGRVSEQAFSVEDVFTNIGWIAVAVSVWVMVSRLWVHPARARHAFQRRDAVLVVPLDMLVSMLSFLLMGGFAYLVGGGGQYPAVSDPSPGYLAGFFASMAAAGFREEIFLLALPVLLLRSARRSWWEIVAVLVVIRLSFHIYYGVSVVGLVLWAAAAVAFFRYTQSVWPLVVSHSLLDVFQAAGRFGGDLGLLAWTLWVLVMVASFAWLVTRKTPVRAELGLTESALTQPWPGSRTAFAARR